MRLHAPSSQAPMPTNSVPERAIPGLGCNPASSTIPPAMVFIFIASPVETHKTGEATSPQGNRVSTCMHALICVCVCVECVQVRSLCLGLCVYSNAPLSINTNKVYSRVCHVHVSVCMGETSVGCGELTCTQCMWILHLCTLGPAHG